MSNESPRYRHTPDMGEISGFGGGYEECCQDMLEAGVRWLNEHKGADLQASEMPDVFGIIRPDSPDCEALSEAVVAGAKGEATGAMHHAVMGRLLWIDAHSWGEYCDTMRRLEAEGERGA